MVDVGFSLTVANGLVPFGKSCGRESFTCDLLFSELDKFEFIGGAIFIDGDCGLFKDGDCSGGGGGGGGGAAPL